MANKVDTVKVTMNVMLLEEKGLIKWNNSALRYEPTNKNVMKEIIETLTKQQEVS